MVDIRCLFPEEMRLPELPSTESSAVISDSLQPRLWAQFNILSIPELLIAGKCILRHPGTLSTGVTSVPLPL